MSQALKSDFDRDGFVHIPGYLSQEELAEWHENLRRYERTTVPGLPPDRALYDGTGPTRQLKTLVDMQEGDSYFRGWFEQPRAEALASELLGERARPQTLEYFAKAPRTGTATPPHQDGFYFCLQPSHAVTLWVALDDCDGENGCLNYVRGSHRQGIADHQASGVVGFSQGLGSLEADEKQIVAMPVRAGDCLAHHSATIHFADANRSDWPRRSFGAVFYAASCRRDEAAWQRYMASLAAQRRELNAAAAASQPN